MLTLNDGRNELWQWDTGRKLEVDVDCSQVHFSNKVFGRSIDVDVVDGVATIPDILLQTDKELNVWAFVGTAENGYTKISKTFKVNRRNKPADYVFTPPEQTTLEEIKEKLDYLESIQDPDAIKNAVDEYLANNPIQIDEKDPTVPDWAKQTTKPKYTATEVGAVAKVNGVKPDANGNVEITIPDSGGNVENGEDGFSPIATVTQTDTGAVISITDKEGTTTATITNGKDGRDGVDGQPGKDGYTPQKNVDYFDGKDGKDGSPGSPGANGSDGITPHIGSNGNWFIGNTDTGKPSRGADGQPGQNGSPGKDGSNGQPGADGVSPTVAVSKSGKVTTVSITDKNGTKTATINDGADGSPGSAGKDGTSVTVESVSESAADGGSNVVTFSDGKTLTVKNGKAGATGKTAYQYAQDGGYTGTEAEFSAKLANEYNLNPLYGKKISLIGDSICAGANDGASYLGGYGKIIADRNNMAYENFGKAGSTITAETYSSSDGRAKGWICRMVENMSADADYAIIEGGINDAWQWIDHGTITIGAITEGYDATLDDTTYYGAFESMLKQLVTKFQGKKIGYIAIPKMMEFFDSERNAPNFYHIALECCAKWGVPVCDLNTIIPPTQYLKTLGTTYTADGTHPTYEGYLKYYCDPIEAWLKTLTVGGNNAATMARKAVEDYTNGFNDAIQALQTGKLDNTGVSFRRAKLPLADGTTIEIDVLTAVDGSIIIKYVNRVPISIDTDKTIFGMDYNGDGANDGYLNGYRLSSSGATKEEGRASVTGYIPASATQVIGIAGYKWLGDDMSQSYLCAYDASFNYLGAVTGRKVGYGNNTIYDTVSGDDEVAYVKLANLASIAYVRVSVYKDAGTDGKNIIVTVDEEIT